MTLTELRYIVAVARERHFGRAARACFVSQPTLSIAIKKLEEELGVQLFERQASEITVTPVGEQIVAQAQRTLEAAETIRQVAQQGKDQLAGPLRIGAIYTIGPYLFPGFDPAPAQAGAEHAAGHRGELHGSAGGEAQARRAGRDHPGIAVPGSGTGDAAAVRRAVRGADAVRAPIDTTQDH